MIAQLRAVTGSPFYFWVMHSSEVRFSWVSRGQVLLEWQVIEVSLLVVVFLTALSNFWRSILRVGVIMTLAKLPPWMSVLY